MTLSVTSFSQKRTFKGFYYTGCLQAFTFFPATYSYLLILLWLLHKSLTTLKSECFRGKDFGQKTGQKKLQKSFGK